MFLALLIPSSLETSISFLQLSSFQPLIPCRSGPVWFCGTVINLWERCHCWAAGLFTPAMCIFKHHETLHATCHQLGPWEENLAFDAVVDKSLSPAWLFLGLRSNFPQC